MSLVHRLSGCLSHFLFPSAGPSLATVATIAFTLGGQVSLVVGPDVERFASEDRQFAAKIGRLGQVGGEVGPFPSRFLLPVVRDQFPGPLSQRACAASGLEDERFPTWPGGLLRQQRRKLGEAGRARRRVEGWPVSAITVARVSTWPIRASEVLPARTWPGQRARNGTRCPPAYSPSLTPRRRPLQGWPLVSVRGRPLGRSRLRNPVRTWRVPRVATFGGPRGVHPGERSTTLPAGSQAPLRLERRGSRCGRRRSAPGTCIRPTR